MLFALVINTHKGCSLGPEFGLFRRLRPRVMMTIVLLYANDVVIFCHQDREELSTLHSLLELFGQASGLHTNFAMCSVSLIGDRRGRPWRLHR